MYKNGFLKTKHKSNKSSREKGTRLHYLQFPLLVTKYKVHQLWGNEDRQKKHIEGFDAKIFALHVNKVFFAVM